MGILKDLKLFKEGTSSEILVRDYILENIEKIEELSARELGKITYTSAATVTRFCNKLGYKGYLDFKMKFISELKVIDKEHKLGEIEINERENVVTIMRKMTEIEKKAVEDTANALSFEKLKIIRKLIHEAETVDFYAYDINVYVAQYASSQLLYAGKKSTVNTATNMRALNALLSNKKNVAIVISQTGENSRLVEFVKILKQRETKVIVITTSKKSTLAGMGDEYIYAATTKSIEAFLTPTFISSVKYILDIIWGLEFSYDLGKNMSLNKLYEKKGESHLWGLIKGIEEMKKNI
ncbi:MurR/RpiR family transcriptional regulator [Fusobacterium perfoetens]|uniref:MurR/RpiR family transcriptional regulator n=1 Tax=Fusobacterium perfoetens TaxID=852 RepID=UPI0026EF2F68|nr:MurR/RpiR family transcriptional regulator [Fusobacterium perfoetens]